MNNVLEVAQYAREYISKRYFASEKKVDKLDRSLQYLLIRTSDRVINEFGEITKPQIVLLIESWIIAQGTEPEHKRPYDVSVYDYRGEKLKGALT